MSKIQLKSVDLNKLMTRFVGNNCRFENGDIHFKGGDFKVHAKNIDIKTSADIEAGGLRVHVKELRFNHEGADVDFALE